jgi:hypothetical protein
LIQIKSPLGSIFLTFKDESRNHFHPKSPPARGKTEIRAPP